MMRKVSFLLGAILLVGCASRPPPPTSRPPSPVAARPTPPVLSPADYLAISASRSLLLVRGAELVAGRSPELAPDAQRIAAAHRGVAAQLNFAGRRLNLLPAAELLPTDRAQFEALAEAGNPGAAWQLVLGTALANCDRHEGDYAVRGSSATLRPVARFTLGVCREELARLR